MFTISIHWTAALQALGISLVMSFVFFILDFLVNKFDRSNSNETGIISGFIFLVGLVVANVVSVVGGLFFGISATLFLIVGLILFLTVSVSALTISGRL